MTAGTIPGLASVKGHVGCSSGGDPGQLLAPDRRPCNESGCHLSAVDVPSVTGTAFLAAWRLRVEAAIPINKTRRLTSRRALCHSMQSVKKLWLLLDRRQRRNSLLLLALMISGALLEVIGVGAIPAFVALLSGPDRVLRYPAIARLFTMVGANRRTRGFCGRRGPSPRSSC